MNGCVRTKKTAGSTDPKYLKAAECWTAAYHPGGGGSAGRHTGWGPHRGAGQAGCQEKEARHQQQEIQVKSGLLVYNASFYLYLSYLSNIGMPFYRKVSNGNYRTTG